MLKDLVRGGQGFRTRVEFNFTLCDEVPGVHVPDEVMRRLRRADTKESARREGIEVAREMLLALLPDIDGVQIAAPFGRVQTAIDVAAVVPEERRGEADSRSA